jgi:hypothetical protein
MDEFIHWLDPWLLLVINLWWNWNNFFVLEPLHLRRSDGGLTQRAFLGTLLHLYIQVLSDCEALYVCAHCSQPNFSSMKMCKFHVSWIPSFDCRFRIQYTTRVSLRLQIRSLCIDKYCHISLYDFIVVDNKMDDIGNILNHACYKYNFRTWWQLLSVVYIGRTRSLVSLITYQRGGDNCWLLYIAQWFLFIILT